MLDEESKLERKLHKMNENEYLDFTRKKLKE